MLDLLSYQFIDASKQLLRLIGLVFPSDRPKTEEELRLEAEKAKSRAEREAARRAFFIASPKSAGETQEEYNEKIEIRKQAREFLLKRNLEAGLLYYEEVQKDRRDAATFSKEYGQIVVRLLFFLNGGSILSLLAFFGTVLSRSDAAVYSQNVALLRDVAPAFWCYGLGLVFITFTAAMGYMNWQWASQSYVGPARFYDWLERDEIISSGEVPSKAQALYFSYWTSLITTTLAALGFIIGSSITISQFSNLGALPTLEWPSLSETSWDGTS